MKLNLRITAGLLLLVHTFHAASLRDSTDSPGRTIMKEWLRGQGKNTAGSQNAALPVDGEDYDQGEDTTAPESSNGFSSGIASGSIGDFKEENGDDDANDGSDDLTAVTTNVPPTDPDVTTKEAELPDTTVSPSDATTDPTNSSSINATEDEEEFNTSAPEGNATQESTTRDKDAWSTNATGSTNTTTVTTAAAPEMNGTSTSSSPTTVFSSSNTTTPEMNGTSTSSSPTTVFSSSTTAASEMNGTSTTSSPTTTVFLSSTTATPETNGTSTTSSPTTVFTSETTEASPETTTVAEKTNRTGEGSASGDNPDRGLESDPRRGKRNGAWGAVLGTAVAVAFVGLVAYVILKRKHQKGFSHRKLVEEYPSDPVLRLDNSEPLDLNLGGSAYYNPALQGDSIQMSNLPGRR